MLPQRLDIVLYHAQLLHLAPQSLLPVLAVLIIHDLELDQVLSQANVAPVEHLIFQFVLIELENVCTLFQQIHLHGHGLLE